MRILTAVRPIRGHLSCRRAFGGHLRIARPFERAGQLPEFETRLCCYQIHIGLDSQAYCAFAGRFKDLEDAARRTLQFLASE